MVNIRKIETEQSRMYLEKGDFLLALLRTAADLEELLFYQLFFKKRISIELMPNWSLGKNIEWCSSLGLIDKKYKPVIEKFLQLRNLVIHQRLFFENMLKDAKSIIKFKGIISSVCDFMDKNPVIYSNSSKIEGEFTKFMNKERIKAKQMLG